MTNNVGLTFSVGDNSLQFTVVVETPVPSKGLAWMKCPFVMSMTRFTISIEQDS
jgi:hypothetical protein